MENGRKSTKPLGNPKHARSTMSKAASEKKDRQDRPRTNQVAGRKWGDVHAAARHRLAPLQARIQSAIDHSPPILVQRMQIESAFGGAIQRQPLEEEEEPLQGKFATGTTAVLQKKSSPNRKPSSGRPWQRASNRSCTSTRSIAS